MELSRGLINAIGSVVLAVILSGGALMMVAISVDSHNTTAHAGEVDHSNQVTREELAGLAHQEVMLPWMHHDLDELRKQIPGADELSDASALASAAAKSSGARILAISFGGRQVFAAPAGVGMGDDGQPTAPQATVKPGTLQLQLPVTFEVDVSSTAQAGAFIDGLRSGPRMLQVVQAQASPTNDAKRFTLTVDALIFSAKG